MVARKKRELPAFDPAESGRFACRVLEEAGVPGALIGRLAIWAWVPEESEHPLTKDMDIAVARENMPFIRDWLARHGLRTRELPIGGINVFYPDLHINIDFIERSSPLYGDLSALFSKAIKAAYKLGEIVNAGGADLLVVPPEHLVAMKLATGDDDDEEDAGRVLENVDVDVEQIRLLLREHVGIGSLGRFENILRRIGHFAARPKRKYED
ncbi:MAG: hypothetical protein FJ125_00900 [Deltaproteobacteria bacterium]|nr:hypothetical protein [Deltaproteobacteria bacterium]